MNRRRLEAIVAVKHTLIRRFEKGFMLRGVDIEVTLNMDNFAGEGDVNLFGRCCTVSLRSMLMFTFSTSSHWYCNPQGND